MMLFTTLVVSFRKDGRVSVTERQDQCGKKHHSCELLMMGIVMFETC